MLYVYVLFTFFSCYLATDRQHQIHSEFEHASQRLYVVSVHCMLGNWVITLEAQNVMNIFVQ